MASIVSESWKHGENDTHSRGLGRVFHVVSWWMFFLPVKDDETLLSAFRKSNASWESFHRRHSSSYRVQISSALFSDTFLFSFQRQTRPCNVLAKHFISLYLRQSKTRAASKNESSLLAPNQAHNTSVKGWMKNLYSSRSTHDFLACHKPTAKQAKRRPQKIHPDISAFSVLHRADVSLCPRPWRMTATGVSGFPQTIWNLQFQTTKKQ